jgi:hypothetical protein
MEHHNNKDEGEIMRGRKFFSGGVLLAAALLLVAIPASASAKTELQFTEGGSPAPQGAAASLFLSIGQECVSSTAGKLGVNPEKKVVVTGSTSTSANCTHETAESQSGNVEEEVWASNEKVKVKADVKITYPGPCVYEYTKFKPEPLEIPRYGAIAIGETQGKLIEGKKAKKPGEAGACEKKVTKGFYVYTEDAEEELFQLELI